MSTIANQKRTLAQKFLQFQKTGLVSYGKYLDDQLKFASKSEIRKAYKKYIETEIDRNKTKIARIDAKLKKK